MQECAGVVHVFSPGLLMHSVHPNDQAGGEMDSWVIFTSLTDTEDQSKPIICPPSYVLHLPAFCSP
jgi:hypothetical protein